MTLLAGHLNQTELSQQIDGFIKTQNGDTEHCHNQLVTAIFANVTREMPDIGVASWVSANDKPTSGTGSKPISGDAAEQRLKTEITQLPNRDRRRLKELSQNKDVSDQNSTERFLRLRQLPIRSTPTMFLPICLASIANPDQFARSSTTQSQVARMRWVVIQVRGTVE